MTRKVILVAALTAKRPAAAYVWSTARSGIPTGCAVLSLHCSAAVMSSRNSAVVPTIASEFPHAVVTALRASSAVNFESAVFTTT